VKIYLWKSRVIHEDGQVHAPLTDVKPALFIEVDGMLAAGTIFNPQTRSCCALDMLRPIPSLVEPIAQLRESGLLVIGTTAQPAIARGEASRREVERLLQSLQAAYELDDILLCPHEADDDCPCRKPRPGLFKEASYKHHIDLDHSFVLGNRWQDAEAARAVGCTSVLVQSPWLGRGHRDCVCPDVAAAFAKIETLNHRREHYFA
jgi:D-glycero-D-manno-heptose 1,7-bisphosphate phosphatase